MDNELLNILKSIQTKIDSIENKVTSIEERMDKGFNDLSHRMDEISQGIGKTISFELSDELEKDDLEILEDMIKIATNDALKQIEKEVNNKLGSQAGALGGLL